MLEQWVQQEYSAICGRGSYRTQAVRVLVAGEQTCFGSGNTALTLDTGDTSGQGVVALIPFITGTIA